MGGVETGLISSKGIIDLSTSLLHLRNKRRPVAEESKRTVSVLRVHKRKSALCILIVHKTKRYGALKLLWMAGLNVRSSW